MNRRIFFLALVFFAVAVLVAPVMAKPAQKVVFSGLQIGNSPENQPPSPDIRTWDTEGGTHHVRNWLGAGTITLTIGDEEPIAGTTSSEIMANSKVGVHGFIKFDMKWTFTDGTFAGNIIGTPTSPTILEDIHGVLQGSGAYECWIVLLNGDYSAPVFQYSGTVVITN